MAGVIRIIGRTRIELLGNVIDGFLSDDHQIQIDTTQFPVQSGGNLVDHAVVRPEVLNLTGFVSNVFASAGVNVSTSLIERPGQAWAAMREQAYSREVLVVDTPLRIYEDMLIIGLSATQDENTGRGLIFRLSLREVQFRTLQEAGGAGIVAAPGSAQADRTISFDAGRVSIRIINGVVIGGL